jgi:NTP pyrophosphatase (non-canonical NTP hydrolase)
MTFNEYNIESAKTDIYPNDCKPWVYALGLAGETGELCDKLKKMYRDNNGAPNPDIIDALSKECGDVLWYLAQFAKSIGFTLEDIAMMNIAKLASRKARGVIGGSGDER